MKQWEIARDESNRRARAAKAGGYAVVAGWVVRPEYLHCAGYHEPVCKLEDYPVEREG